MSTNVTFWGPAALMKRNLTIERRLELAKCYRQGDSANTLSKAFGITIRQVYRIVAEERGDTKAKRDPSRHVTFRAPKSEINAFLAVAMTAGITGPSQAFRVLLRMAQGLFEIFPNQLDEINKTVWLKGKELDLLNQLAKSVHKGKLRLGEEDRALLARSIDTNARLHEEWRAVLDDAKTRRGYAVARMTKAKDVRQ